MLYSIKYLYALHNMHYFFWNHRYHNVIIIQACRHKYMRLFSECMFGIIQGKPAPLHSWWAVLPPPLDLIVGLRQVRLDQVLVSTDTPHGGLCTLTERVRGIAFL